MANLYLLSMGDQALDILQSALDIWNEYFEKIINLLTKSPEDLYPGVWSAMKTINEYLSAVGAALLVVFFYIGLTKSTLHFEELRRPEKFFGYFIRLVLAEAIVINSFDIMLNVLQLFQGCISGIVDLFEVSNNAGQLAGIPEAISELVLQSNTIEGLVILMISFVGCIIIFALSLILLLLVYLRFFKIYIYAAVSPIPLSSFGGESTSRIGRSFIMNYLSVCLQGIIIAIAFIIFAKVVSIDFQPKESSSVVTNLLKYIGVMSLQALLLVSTVRSSDRLTKEMIGG